MRVWIGRSLLLIAGIHTVFGVLAFGGEARRVVDEGLFDTVRLDDASPRNVGFWSFMSGALLFVVGGLVNQSERREPPSLDSCHGRCWRSHRSAH